MKRILSIVVFGMLVAGAVDGAAFGVEWTPAGGAISTVRAKCITAVVGEYCSYKTIDRLTRLEKGGRCDVPPHKMSLADVNAPCSCGLNKGHIVAFESQSCGL